MSVDLSIPIHRSAMHRESSIIFKALYNLQEIMSKPVLGDTPKTKQIELCLATFCDQIHVSGFGKVVKRLLLATDRQRQNLGADSCPKIVTAPFCPICP